MANNIYSIKKGEKYPITIKLKNKDLDTPIDLTNAVIKFQIKDELKDEFCIIEKVITIDTDVYTEGRIVDPENGEIIIKFTDEDFDKLIVERIYYITIWWEIPDEDFAKVISSNNKDYLKFMVCVP
jgi:hypothetical protein